MALNTLKLYWREITIAVLLVFGIWITSLKNKTIVETKIEYVEKVVVRVQEKIEYRDRVQVKTRTVHKKGAEIYVKEVTRTDESRVDSSIYREQEQETRIAERKSVETTTENPRFVLGISRDFSTGRVGAAVLYRPIPSLPVYVGPQVNVVNRVWTFGIGVNLLL